MEIVRRHILFFGRVQGVGFRYHSVYKARQLGLTGWVRNLFDGSVEMEVQGRQEQIEQLLGYLREQRFVMIDRMDIRDIPTERESGFWEKDY